MRFVSSRIPDAPVNAAVPPAAAVFEDDEPWRFLAAAGDAQKRPRAHPPEFGRAEQPAAQTCPAGQIPCAPAQLRGGQGVPGFVHQVSSGVGGLGHDPPASNRLGHGPQPLPIPHDKGENGDLSRVLGILLIAGEPIEAEQRPLAERLRRLGGIEAPGTRLGTQVGPGPVDDGADPAGADLAEVLDRLGRDDSHPLQGEVLRLPQPHHQDPIHRQLPQGVD